MKSVEVLHRAELLLRAADQLDAATKQIGELKQAKEAAESARDTWQHRALFEQTLTEELRAKYAAELAASEKRAGSLTDVMKSLQHICHFLPHIVCAACIVAPALADQQQRGQAPATGGVNVES